ncbi:sec-independent protein translocase protein TatA [Microbacterium sp. SORGH_AS 1204]|uniref:twin-arginine translocase TatA/TatE family subunit n=1 Tax=Microbacterium sp. SORGH_AS_1204 TaxID=3041785 RepID=UPI00278D3DD5|nr:twin-arginine translocase TatA/TatE family subunit [Microbacterium sp. SORGH_AS_1204]MDQ1137895.1 sec-independent protein translocase protein TatA [Microbacterium sp. SORGH_AS_1204]
MGIFGNAFSGWHLLLILAVILLLFGAAKLPGLAKSVGESVRILRSESKDSTPVGGETAETDHGDATRGRPSPPTAT